MMKRRNSLRERTGELRREEPMVEAAGYVRPEVPMTASWLFTVLIKFILFLRAANLPVNFDRALIIGRNRVRR